MRAWPLLSEPGALCVLRLTLAVLCITQAFARLWDGAVPQLEALLQAWGLPAAGVLAWGLTGVELAAGVALAAGWAVRLAAGSLVVVAVASLVMAGARDVGSAQPLVLTGAAADLMLLMVLLVLGASAPARRQDDRHLAPEAAPLTPDEVERRLLSRQVRAALDAGRFHAVYRPQVVASTHRVAGFMSAGRMRATAGASALSPEVFLPVLAREGWMEEYCSLMLRQVLADVPTVCKAYGSTVRLSCDVPAALFVHPVFPARLAMMLQQAGVASRNLALQVTEDVFREDAARLRAACAALRALGVQVVLDGFGRGFTALRGLREAQFDEVRIDAGFVQDVETDARSAWVLSALCDLGRDFNCRVAVEGGDDIESLERLGRLGGDCVLMASEYAPERVAQCALA